MLSIYQLSHYTHIRGLYKDLSLEVHLGEILGIVGSNGAGKSTLLRAISTLEKGVSITKGHTISFLSQENIDEHCTVLEIALNYQPQLYSVASHTDLYADMGGFNFEYRLQQLLPHISLDSRMEEYSLGQRQWIRLISLFQSPSEILLLDEPTNYLDLEHVDLFKRMLLAHKHKAAVLMITHNRSLLDEVVNKTLYLGLEGWEIVEGGYSLLVDHQTLERKSKVNLSLKLKKEIDHLNEESVRRKVWAGKTEKQKRGAVDKGFVGARAAKLAKRGVQAEQKQTKKLEELQSAHPFIKKKLRLNVEDYVVYSKQVVNVEKLSKKYEKILFSDLSFTLESHDRIALYGPNGCGKSTLIRCLVGLDQGYTGTIHWNPYLKWYYLPQGLEGFFKGHSLADHFSHLNIDLNLIRKRLGSMMLRDSIWDQELHLLSSGEKMRVALVEAMIMRSEFLILDEPTNHLDIESLEILDDLLDAFPGGFLFVSHDKRFLKRHSNKIIDLGSYKHLI